MSNASFSNALNIPTGGSPLHLAVPAFWTLESKFQPFWAQLQASGNSLAITVVDGSWPSAAQNDPSFKSNGIATLNGLPGIVLGYVSTRQNGIGPLQPAAQIEAAADAWHAQFGSAIDGVYFDELVVPEVPSAVTDMQGVVTRYKQAHPTGRVMVLAGQCINEAVLGNGVDWAILWEDNYTATLTRFSARTAAGTSQIPTWWKNSAYRQRIAHIVHDCAEPQRQHVLGLANERNAGLVFVMDQRGPNHAGTPDEAYDHLPPYWNNEVTETASYYDFGLPPEFALRGAHRWGTQQGGITAWPNFEAVWSGGTHVRGTMLLAAGPHAEFRDVPVSQLVDPLAGTAADPNHVLVANPPLSDVPALWRAAHSYAQNNGFETAIPTFETAPKPAGQVCGMVLLHKGLSWLQPTTVSLGATDEQPTFAEPGSVIRNVNRVAGNAPAKAAICTFMPDDPVNPLGRSSRFNAYQFGAGAPVTHQDVPTTTYISLLG